MAFLIPLLLVLALFAPAGAGAQCAGGGVETLVTVGCGDSGSGALDLLFGDDWDHCAMDDGVDASLLFTWEWDVRVSLGVESAAGWTPLLDAAEQIGCVPLGICRAAAVTNLQFSALGGSFYDLIIDSDGGLVGGFDYSIECRESDLCLDGIDNDGDGLTDCADDDCADADGDGDLAIVCGGADCEDRDPSVSSATIEVCNNLDDNCDGVPDEPFDRDADGATWCAGDCNDLDPLVRPGAAELCDGLDSDCDGAIPPDELDIDGDGLRPCDGDCDDADPEVHPGRAEDCGDPLTDANCDGSADLEMDLDSDGVGVCSGDCDDNRPTVYGGDAPALELCDGLDNDCDGGVDEDFDLDEDGFVASSAAECVNVVGWALDCDDDDADVFPGTIEICLGMGAGVDEDCDGLVDEEQDIDGDGWSTCAGTPGGGDCNDANPDVSPGAPELCDGRDNDCDGGVDEGFDVDGDGFRVCTGECNDDRADVHPAAVELCDRVDNDCDGEVDEEGDEDGDGFCGAFDCDDLDPDVCPDSADDNGVCDEVCDGRDNDCDGRVDEGFDADGDGVARCNNDCDDRAGLGSGIGPFALERCADLIDNDCDGLTDTDDDDCLGPGLRELPYGCGCANGVGSSGVAFGLLLPALLFLGLRIGRRRRCWFLAVTLLLIIMGSGIGNADEMVLYVADDAADHSAEAERVLALRGVVGELGRVLRLGEFLDTGEGGLYLAADVAISRCVDGVDDAADSVARGREAAIEGAYTDAVRLLGEALDDLPCRNERVDRSTLAELFLYRAYARVKSGRPRVAAWEYRNALAVDPALRRPGSIPLLLRRDLLGLAAQEASDSIEVRVELGGGDALGIWLDGGGWNPGSYTFNLQPGPHLLQWRRSDGMIEGAVFELDEQGFFEALGRRARLERVLAADRGAQQARRAWQLLEAQSASMETMPEHIFVLDLRGAADPEDLPVLRFDPIGRNVERVLTVAEAEARRIAEGGKPFRRDCLRFAALGGYAYQHPYNYGSVGLDVDLKVLGPLVIELSLGAMVSNAQPLGILSEDLGPVLVWAPRLALGPSLSLGDGLFRTRVAFRFTAGLDRPDLQGIVLSPGGELGVVGDLLLSGSSAVFLRLRLALGVQGFRFLQVDTTVGPMQPVPTAGVLLGIGLRGLKPVGESLR